jgi:hypothetical protein
MFELSFANVIQGELGRQPDFSKLLAPFGRFAVSAGTPTRDVPSHARLPTICHVNTGAGTP